MKPNEINQLLVQVSLKNQLAFRQLYVLCSPKIYGLLIKVIQDRELAADTLQEVFTKIWLNSHKCDTSQGHGWAWVCQLARNSALDKLRKINKYPASIEDCHVKEVYQDSDTQLQTNIDINNCLSQLTEKSQKAIVLSYIHGLSHAQLSKNLALPLGTLKSTIRRSMKELALCLNL